MKKLIKKDHTCQFGPCEMGVNSLIIDYNTNTNTPKKIKPSISDLIIFRAIAFSNENKLTFLEKIKLRLAFSVVGLFFSFFLFNNFYIVETKGRIIGFAIYRLGLLRALFVINNSHRKGVASSLVNKIILDIAPGKLVVKPTKAAAGFYLRLGFKEHRRGLLIK